MIYDSGWCSIEYILLFRFHRFDHKIKAIKQQTLITSNIKKQELETIFQERDPDLIKAVELYLKRERD